MASFLDIGEVLDSKGMNTAVIHGLESQCITLGLKSQNEAAMEYQNSNRDFFENYEVEINHRTFDFAPAFLYPKLFNRNYKYYKSLDLYTCKHEVRICKFLLKKQSLETNSDLAYFVTEMIRSTE